MTRQALLTLIAVLVAAVWSIVTLMSLVYKDYTPLTIVTPVFWTIVACLFAIRPRVNGNGNNRGNP